MDPYDIKGSSSSWIFFVKTSFAVAVGAIVAGIFLLPGTLLVKGYFGLSSLFLVNSTITLSKTLRDQHEAQRLINKVSEARTSKMLKEFSS